MKYMTRKRFKGKCIQGEVNIPYGTNLDCVDGLLMYNNKPVCYDTSQNALDYFVSNDDDRGVERAQLIEWVLSHTDRNYHKKELYDRIWDMLWNNPKYQDYKRLDCPDVWIWYKNFYISPIEKLQELISDIKIIEQGDC